MQSAGNSVTVIINNNRSILHSPEQKRTSERYFIVLKSARAFKFQQYTVDFNSFGLFGSFPVDI